MKLNQTEDSKEAQAAAHDDNNNNNSSNGNGTKMHRTRMHTRQEKKMSSE